MANHGKGRRADRRGKEGVVGTPNGAAGRGLGKLLVPDVLSPYTVNNFCTQAESQSVQKTLNFKLRKTLIDELDETIQKVTEPIAVVYKRFP